MTTVQLASGVGRRRGSEVMRVSTPQRSTIVVQRGGQARNSLFSALGGRGRGVATANVRLLKSGTGQSNAQRSISGIGISSS